MRGTDQPNDPSVDAIVARAAQAAVLPTAEHKTLYDALLADLQHELDADPSPIVGGGS
ncbi:hypothetical protein [Arthrobacter alpinus]|uniref:hypothetical protein n=1 Tax=Arthrobacter alpinus TaxID=656366 RepID=UPI000A649185|nr:hypothetical protein [Arthrobacter alpinus]